MDTEVTRSGAGRTASTEEILDGLNDLLQLDHDAVGAYEIAMEKLENRDHAGQIAGFRLDHERHIRELNEVIAALGGTPKNHPHATGPFKLALQSLGGVAGDKGVLMAFRTNELQVRTKYDAYAAKANHWPADIKRTVDRCALDEERHYRWVSDVMASMGLGAGEGPEIDAMDRMREQGGSTLQNLTGKAGDLAGAARDKVSAGMGAVTNRISGLVDAGGDQAEWVQATVGDTVDTVRVRAGDAARDVRERMGDFEDRVREKPLQTLLIAGIAGFVIGRLLR